MKRTILLVTLLIASAWSSPQAAPKKHALLIGIGNYPAESGYPTLNSLNDVPLMRAALLAQGFAEGNIDTVLDNAATRVGILAALQKLTRAVAPGDVVVIHYAGHGHRITDQDGDELDGFDELLVPYGAPSRVRDPSYKGELHIRDDELGAELLQLRQRLGPKGNVMIALDACYSGSATRAVDQLPVRGGIEPIRIGRAQPAAGVDKTTARLEAPTNTRSGSVAAGSAGLAPSVVFSAARHDQRARETYDENRKPVGSLSLALARALTRAEPDWTYGALFEQVAEQMAAMSLVDQEPQLEGDVDATLFAGRAIEQQSFHSVRRMIDDTVAVLRAGTLLGLFPGTEVEFHAPGTAKASGARALAAGIVNVASPLEAQVRLKSAGPRTLTSSRAFVTSFGYPDLRLRVKLDARLPAPAARTLTSALTELAIAQVSAERPDIILRPAARGIAVVAAADDRTLAGPFADGAALGAEVRDAIRRYARTRYLRELSLADPALRPRIEIVRIAPRLRQQGGTSICPTGQPTILPATDANGVLELPVGAEFVLRVHNEGDEGFFLTVLDLPADGSVTQLYPPPGERISDNRLPPGRNYTMSEFCFQATEPLGMEVIKVFATRERMDFSRFLTDQPTNTRGVGPHPLEQLITGANQGTRSASGRANAGATHAVTVKIVPKTK